MTWTRVPELCLETAETEFGTYFLSRTMLNVAVLKFNGREIRRCQLSRAGDRLRRFADEHHDYLRREKT